MTTTPRPSLADVVTGATGRVVTPPRAFRSRRPTGTAAHPLVLLAGGAKTGKSFAIADASRDSRVSRMTVVEVGNDLGALDGYGTLDGAAFELVEHDGTAADVLAAIQQAAEQPPVDGGYSILAIDGATQLWAILSREAQRGVRDMGASGWAALNGAWDDLLSTLRRHPGPVILTARTDDRPGSDDDLSRVRVQKDLAFDVDVVVQAVAHREFVLTGARSLALAKATSARLPLDLGDLNIADLLDTLGGAA